MSLAADGWVLLPGLAAGVLEAWQAASAELRDRRGPLLRQLTSREEEHELDAWGRVLNPVVITGDETVRDLLMRTLSCVVPAVTEAFGSPALTQAVWVHSTRGTALHTDPHPIEPGAPLLGAWVALQDIDERAGPFVVVPGSRELDPTAADVAAWRAASAEAARAQFVARTDPTGSAGARAAELLERVIAARGLEPVSLLPRGGDVILWDGAIAHGSLAPEPGPQTRRSLLLHFVERRFAG